MEDMRRIIEAHRFFCRKSQHYVMGNWNEYEEWFLFGDGHTGEFNWNKWRYINGFIPAYIRFMYWSLKDLTKSPTIGDI